MEPNGGVVEAFVRALEGDYFLQREVADALHCSRSLLQQLRIDDYERLGPSFAAEFEGEMVLLYVQADVERIRQHISNRKQHLAVDATPDSPGVPGQSLNRIGRPALFTPEEAHERQNRHSKAGYWKAQAAKYAHRGNMELAEAAQQRCDAIRAILQAEHEARSRPAEAPKPKTADYQLVVG